MGPSGFCESEAVSDSRSRLPIVVTVVAVLMLVDVLVAVLVLEALRYLTMINLPYLESRLDISKALVYHFLFS